jgi:hypothetical protein
MFVLSGTPTIWAKSINSKWSKTGLLLSVANRYWNASSVGDMSQHLICHNTWTGAVLKTGEILLFFHDINENVLTFETITAHSLIVFHYLSLQNTTKTRIVLPVRSLNGTDHHSQAFWVAQLKYSRLLSPLSNTDLRNL